MRRILPTLTTEAALADQGAEYVLGLDEVGRGALAGPAMVGVVAVRSADLPHLKVPDGVADSKMLTPARRLAMYRDLEDWAAGWAVGVCSNHEIDQWGIVHALGIAALRALAELEHGMNLGADCNLAAILDGPHDYITPAADSFDAPDLPILPKVSTQVKGDAHCASVACAAVIAKVTRDQLMVRLAASDPALAPYQWEHNKGYGSPAHLEAIRRLGPSRLHRVSWHLPSSDPGRG